MSVLIEDQDLITITVYYTSIKNKFNRTIVKVLDEHKAKEMLIGPDAEKVKTLNTKWRNLSWKAQNDLFSESTVYNQSTGTKEVDWTAWRSNTMLKSLVDWDLVDDTGRPYPVTEDNINKLHASIGNALSNAFTEATSLEENELPLSPAKS